MRIFLREFGVFIGVYIRFHFLRIIGKPKSIEYFKGNSDDPANVISHGCLNLIVGLPIVILILGTVHNFV